MRKIALAGAGFFTTVAAMLGSGFMPGVTTPLTATKGNSVIVVSENAPANKSATPTSQQNMVITDNRILPGSSNDRKRRSTQYGHQPRQKMQKHTNRQRCKHNAKLKRRKK